MKPLQELSVVLEFTDLPVAPRDVEFTEYKHLASAYQQAATAMVGIPAAMLGAQPRRIPLTPEDARGAYRDLLVYGTAVLEESLLGGARQALSDPERWPGHYREALRLEAVSWLVLHGGAFAFNAGRT